MNSAQRRQAKRKFSHVVSMQAQIGQRYFEHDGRVLQACTWCQKQFSKGSWQLVEGWDHAEFKFAQEKDAVHFALKWA